jgi:hypothetical protein
VTESVWVRAFRRRSVPLWVDCTIALLLFTGAAVWGTAHWKHSTVSGQPFYYQNYFEPAVMIACGKGFVVAQPQVPAMVEFLWRRADRFSCDAIPPGANLGTEGLYQAPWRYLMFAVGVSWRVLGVSWSGLGPLFGALFGLTIAAAYAIVRLGAGPLLAVLCACGLSVSGLHLFYLPQLRDYAKAPFTLILVFLLGFLVKRPATWRSTLPIAAAYGAVLGLGYGFRTDFLANIPPFFLTLIAFLEGGLLKNLRLKAAAGALCAFTFLLVAQPIVSSVYRSGGCQWHTALLGFARDFSEPLGVADAPYDVSREYLDDYVYVTVTSYAARAHPGVGHIEYCLPQYDAATGQFLADVVKRFPADIVVRGYASTLRIVEAPFVWLGPDRLNAEGVEQLPPNPEGGRGLGLAIVLIAIGIATAVSMRIALFLMFFLLYFGGYPAIQFGTRHYFHLEFITWWAAAFILQALVTELWPLWTARRETRHGFSVRQVSRAALVLAGGFVALLAIMWTARVYQQATVRSLLDRYLSAAKDEIPLQQVLSGAGLPALRPSPHTDPETADFLEVDLNRWRCGERPIVTFRYGSDMASRKAFSRAFALDRRDDARELTRVFMPVYDRFQGLDFSDTSPGCIDGIYRLRDVGQPLMLEVVLTPGWRNAPLYQRLIGPRYW